MHVIGLCLQKSSIQADPHTPKAHVVSANGRVNIERCQCSCAAGMSEKCKNVSPILLQGYGTGLDSLEVLSCTDMECVWNGRKKEAIHKYDPVPLLDFCHVREIADDITVSDGVLSDICSKL